MIKSIIKRDGTVKPFNSARIHTAVQSAYNAEAKETGNDPVPAFHIQNIVDMVVNQLNETLADKTAATVDNVQAVVEEVLMIMDPNVAQRYIEYRHSRDVSRETRTSLYADIEGLINRDRDDILNENANKDAAIISTQRDLLAGVVSRHFGTAHILPKEIAKAHLSGDIHYHDLDHSLSDAWNCCLVDVKEMFDHGFKLGNAHITTPNSITVAAALIPQIITQVASHTYGGTTINRIDEILSPYAEKTYQKHLQTGRDFGVSDVEEYASTMTLRDIKDAVQAMSYEINTMSSTGGQTPFCTFGFGLGDDRWSIEIQKAILRDRYNGIGPHHDTPVFPKLLFTIKDGHNRNPSDPHYDVKQLALKCSARRMYPDILNYEQVIAVTGGFKACMGCRSFLGEWIDPKTGKPRYDGRNNLGVVSVNLPRIAIEANGDMHKFWELLDERLEVAHKAIDFRINRFRGVKAKVAPILYTEGALGVRMDPEDEIFDLFKYGRASVSLGYIGIHEVMTLMYGDDVSPLNDEVKQNFGKTVVAYLNTKCAEWKEESEFGWGYSVYSTPSESLCDRFCKLDRKRFGDIDGVTDKGYYTNSFHLDVMEKTDPYTKINFEKDYPVLTPGGHINYVELPDLQHNLTALENVWDYSYSRVPYFGVNMPSDNCHECGYHGEFDCTNKGFKCPQCGCNDPKKVSVIRRVCGYLGSPDTRPFNEGKQKEVVSRVKHS